jgi:hypothetical protein
MKSDKFYRERVLVVWKNELLVSSIGFLKERLTARYNRFIE